jgi:hypothetical protein
MQVRVRSQAHPPCTFLLLCFLVGLLTSVNVRAEGVLPSRDRHRERHREHALIEARRQYKRQFANGTTNATPTTQTATTSQTTDPSLQNFITSLLDETGDGVFGSSVSDSSTFTDSFGKYYSIKYCSSLLTLS